MEQNVDETDNLVFQAYRRDPLATFVLSRQGWKSWKFPIALAFLQLAFIGVGLLVYQVRDGGIDVQRLGGHGAILSTIFFDAVAFLLGARFYLYFSSRSGTIYQALLDRGVIP